MNVHEAGFLTFVEQPQRRRLQVLFDGGVDRRRDVVAMLQHKLRLVRSFSSLLPGDDQFSVQIAALLIERGASTACHVIGGAADGQDLGLHQALAQCVGAGDGCFVSCIPGQLGYFEFEYVSSGRILERPI